MATATPFAVKKDSKENSALSQGISSTNNDAVAMKRVRHPLTFRSFQFRYLSFKRSFFLEEKEKKKAVRY